MKLVTIVPLFVALLCVTAGMRKSVIKINSVFQPRCRFSKILPEPGLYRLVSFAFLVIFWNTQSSLQTREKWPSFQRVKLITSGQDQSKKFIKSGFQTQRYNHKNCYNWSMQAGSIFFSKGRILCLRSPDKCKKSEWFKWQQYVRTIHVHWFISLRFWFYEIQKTILATRMAHNKITRSLGWL